MTLEKISEILRKRLEHLKWNMSDLVRHSGVNKTTCANVLRISDGLVTTFYAFSRSTDISFIGLLEGRQQVGWREVDFSSMGDNIKKLASVEHQHQIEEMTGMCSATISRLFKNPLTSKMSILLEMQYLTRQGIKFSQILSEFSK